MYQGYDQDTVRGISGSYDDNGKPQGRLPKRDTELGDNKTERDAGSSFPTFMGSAHPAGVNIAMCDGSVDSYGFDVDPLVWNGIGGRDDGDVF